MSEPEIQQLAQTALHVMYELSFEGTPHVWDVVAWCGNGVVTDHIQGDLMIKESRREWDGTYTVIRGSRPATSLERQWLSTVIEVFEYEGIDS